MNIDELQSVRDRERQTDKPQQLRESFYVDVGEFIQQLRAERDRVAERTGDPYAPEAMRLKDEIDAARQLVEDIHERRIGKVVKAASLDAAELSPEVDGLTAEEQKLFDALVADIERHRDHVLDIVDGESPSDELPGHDPGNAGQMTASEGTADTGPTREVSEEVTAADAMGAADEGPPDVARTARSDNPPEGTPEAAPERDTAPASGSDRPDTSAGNRTGERSGHDGHDRPTEDDMSDTPVRNDGGRDSIPPEGRDDAPSEDSEPAVSGNSRAPNGGVERERVLVTEELDTFVGFDDRDYDLAPDDVVTLPATNADLLVERDAARRL